MDMQAPLLCRCGVIALIIVMMIESFVVVLIVMIIMIIIDRVQCDGMDRVTGIIVLLMGVRRGGRDEAVACKSKRQAKAHEASDERHDFRLEANCCSLLKSYP